MHAFRNEIIKQTLFPVLVLLVQSSDALYGVLLAGRRLVAVETGRGPPAPNVFDLLLLSNFTNSNESLK
jgi:hypothetical protein